MRCIIFLQMVLNFFLFSTITLQAQKTPPSIPQNEKPLNQIKTNLLGHFGGQYQLSYERFLAKKHISFQCSAAFFKQKVIRLGNNDDGQVGYKSEAAGWLIQPEIRYYFLQNVMLLNNFYLATSFRFRKGKTNITDLSKPLNKDMSGKAHNTTKSSALVIGYQKIIKKYVCLESFIGTQYRIRKSNKTFHSNDISEQQFDDKFAHIESQTLDITGANWNNEQRFLPYLGLNLGILF